MFSSIKVRHVVIALVIGLIALFIVNKFDGN